MLSNLNINGYYNVDGIEAILIDYKVIQKNIAGVTVYSKDSYLIFKDVYGDIFYYSTLHGVDNIHLYENGNDCYQLTSIDSADNLNIIVTSNDINESLMIKDSIVNSIPDIKACFIQSTNQLYNSKHRLSVGETFILRFNACFYNGTAHPNVRVKVTSINYDVTGKFVDGTFVSAYGIVYEVKHIGTHKHIVSVGGEMFSSPKIVNFVYIDKDIIKYNILNPTIIEECIYINFKNPHIDFLKNFNMLTTKSQNVYKKNYLAVLNHAKTRMKPAHIVKVMRSNGSSITPVQVEAILYIADCINKFHPNITFVNGNFANRNITSRSTNTPSQSQLPFSQSNPSPTSTPTPVSAPTTPTTPSPVTNNATLGHWLQKIEFRVENSNGTYRVLKFENLDMYMNSKPIVNLS